jgi:SAM-dependent methyltransferase
VRDSRAPQLLLNGLSQFGIDLRRLGHTIRHLPRFAREARAYARAGASTEFPFRIRSLYPVLTDYAAAAGSASGHYFFQDLWAARKIFAVRPSAHLDLGSRIDGFVAHVLTFMPVTVVDIRPLPDVVAGLHFQQADATTLAGIADASVESISSLHAIEHFGLGRYGDPISASAWRTALGSIARVLRPGGRAYVSVPVGHQRVQFNAHRVLHPATILEAVAPLELISFAAVDDAGVFHAECDPADYGSARFACGMFELSRR